jgi:hypothetical protein
MILRSKLRCWIVGFIVTGAFAALSTQSAVAETAKRLILKDGSYQSVSKYEVKSDRVHYMSSDREEWEELPKSLIDWKATDAFNAGRAMAANTDSAEASELDKELESELKAEEARTPEVAPGLRLPVDGGVMLLDTFKGDQELVEISQNGGELHHNVGKNILRGAINPLASQKQSVELTGLHAFVQSHQVRPVLFISPPPDDGNASSDPAKVAAAPLTPEQASDRFHIVRADLKKETRVVGNVKIAVYGKLSQQEKFIETKTEPVSGGWVKLTPVGDLTTGEYAVVEILGKEGMNLFVWDFGVNPNAPANPSAWKAVGSKQPVKPTESPKLEKRN